MTPPAIRIDDLAFRWRQSGPLCVRLEQLTLAAGTSLFLHGPSGAGKTTLLNLIGGVLLPERGRVELLGRPLGELSAAGRDAFRADHLGFIFQQFNLIPYLSVCDNVLLPCRFSRRRAARAGDPVAAAGRLLAALDLEPALAGVPAAELSGGQQQRVAAARALIGRPEIIIADEPTSALDASRQQGFIDLLLNEARAAGSTVVFVSHDQRLAGHFDEMLELGAAA
ncbi:MAG: ATP-binding cassette domain-containing protein [Dechloromonas sp.]|nr:MAG: ATP-binding cassette domain-containing protein [Dechloromonas sp.]